MNALRQYFETLPNSRSDFRKKLIAETGKDVSTVTRWINGQVPQLIEDRKTISEITGLSLKQLGYENR